MNSKIQWSSGAKEAGHRGLSVVKSKHCCVLRPKRLQVQAGGQFHEFGFDNGHGLTRL